MEKKIRFNVLNIFNETPKEIVRVQNSFKLFTGGLVATTWYTIDPKHSLYIAVIGFIVDAFLCCITIVEVKEK
jgi:hypothetical protein